MFKNMMYWFNNRKTGKAVIILKNGGTVDIDYSKYEDRALARSTSGDYWGHVSQVPLDGTWGGEAPHPLHPTQTIWVSKCAAAADAIAALKAKVAEEVAKETAIQANPIAWIERELQVHDWTAAFSDSPGVSAAADHHWRLIQDILKKVDPTIGAELIAKYRPNF